MANQVFHYSNTGISSGQRFYLKDEVSGLYLNNLNIISDSSIDVGIQGLNGSSLTRRDFVSNMLLFNGLTIPDQDAAAYIASVINTGATVTSGQKSAIDTFVKAEKAASRWNGIKRLYFPVWGLAAANAICMKSLTSCTFNGAFTHASGYIQGGINKYISLGTTLAGLGLSDNSHYFAGLFKTAPSDNFKSILNSDLFIGYGEESLRVVIGGSSCVDDNSFAPSDVFGVISYGGQTTLASRYGKVRKASGTTSVAVQGGTITQSFGSSSITLLGSVSSSYWDGQCGALVLGAYMSAADDLLFTAALETLWETTTSLTLP